MKAMLTGFAAIVLIGIGAYLLLNDGRFSAQQVYSGPNVRLE